MRQVGGCRELVGICPALAGWVPGNSLAIHVRRVEGRSYGLKERPCLGDLWPPAITTRRRRSSAVLTASLLRPPGICEGVSVAPGFDRAWAVSVLSSLSRGITSMVLRGSTQYDRHVGCSRRPDPRRRGAGVMRSSGATPATLLTQVQETWRLRSSTKPIRQTRAQTRVGVSSRRRASCSRRHETVARSRLRRVAAAVRSFPR